MTIDSTALKVNLRTTAVTKIKIPKKYNILRAAVKDYRGVSTALEELLNELYHPYCNWYIVIPELRSFALKHLAIYSRSKRAVGAVRVLLETFIYAIKKPTKHDQRAQATDALNAYLEKLTQYLKPEELIRHVKSIANTFEKLSQFDQKILLEIAKSYHPISKTIKILLEKIGPLLDDNHLLWKASTHLLIKLRREDWNCWLKQPDPLRWLENILKNRIHRPEPKQEEYLRNIIAPISHDHLKLLLAKLKEYEKKKPTKKLVKILTELPGHLDIVRAYKNLAQELSRQNGKLNTSTDEPSLYLLFLFHIVEMEGLAHIHEEIIRELNRNLISLIRTAPVDQLKDILAKSFALLKAQVGNYPRTALQCIQALGTEIFKRGRERLIEIFLEHVVNFGFQPPQVKGVDTEWHILANPAHLQNIRVWLDLIGHDPKACSTLLSALIINLKLGGTCIRDTDLFQKDVTKLLNCNIEPVYNLVKQLAKTLPVYFNEIGAEGLLRDVSTELDEICKRGDILIHFLRKQSHVESNNLIVDFIEAIICFWYDLNTSHLTPYVPKEIIEQIEIKRDFVQQVHKAVKHLINKLNLNPIEKNVHKLLDISEDKLIEYLDGAKDVEEKHKRRVRLLIKMYRLENLKYELGVQEIRHHLEEAKQWGFEGLDELIAALEKDDTEKCLEAILHQLEELKKIILSPQKFEAVENIYHKRHIAVDIPSMYGRYHEKKFDALSLSFRLENLANIYFERLIESIDLPFITKAIFTKIIRCLHLFKRALEIDGVYSKKFITYLRLLEKSFAIRRFTFSQYSDIIKGLFEGVKDMIYVYYISPHRENLPLIIKQLGKENLLPKYKTLDNLDSEVQFVHQISERFLRDLVASTFGLQHLDNFIARVHQVLNEQKEMLDPKDLDLLLTYDPDQALCDIHNPSRRTENLIHLGNKGYNLVLLAKEGMPVPPGIIVTTEIFRCYPILERFPRVYSDFCCQLKKALKRIEKATGRIYGDPSNPLLLSVRSGAAISMPGMMATIINVGSTLKTIEGLAKRTGKTWFAWDNYRRFLQSWGMSFGLTREIFSSLMDEHKKKYGVNKKREFSGEQMKELALKYRQALLDNGIDPYEDPFEQLLKAIKLVLDSWDSDKAKDYREIMDISDYWGTAVIVQTMAFGNLSTSSGTGVLFTANPHKKLDRVALWGDYTPGNQGEDIVSGLVSTYPISVEQSEALGLDPAESLEKTFPNIYNALLKNARILIYDKKWTPQEIEFTFEGPEEKDLFILQSRDMTTKKASKIQAFLPTKELEKSYLAHGIGVSGGALSGRAVFTLDQIKYYRKKEPATKLIFIRSDTVPEDIREISMADGLLTAKGGQTSHAAIVAFRLDKTCVVGCKQMIVYESKEYALINNHKIVPGTFISIDGRSGAIYKGKHKVEEQEDASLI